ncbi:ABC transporter substrate-binding protein [Nocardia sp. NPDC058176]|uniref:ABC transporter substrate-binding protein n=1 Tax=Nocardia sp. NPDC058176 TaxID=3346368 RepID=UPI0036DD489E
MSTIPRRTPLLIVLAAVALLLSSCGSGGTGASGDSPSVTLAGAYGEVDIAVTDEKVWALDPRTATELLALGVTPTHSGNSAHKGDAAFVAREQLLAEAGVELVDPGRIELILQARPSLVVGEQTPSSDELIDELSKIAPVLIIDAATPWDQGLGLLGQATGHRDRAEAIIEHLDQAIATTGADIEQAGSAGEIVSLISACGAGTFCAYGSGRTAGSILTDVGLRRPAAHGQDRGDASYGYTTVSEEKLSELTAPVIFVFTGSVQYGAPNPLDNPLFEVGDARVGEVDFAAWYGSGSFDVPWILNDIRAVLLGEGTIADRQRGTELFQELRKVTA